MAAVAASNGSVQIGTLHARANARQGERVEDADAVFASPARQMEEGSEEDQGRKDVADVKPSTKLELRARGFRFHRSRQARALPEQ